MIKWSNEDANIEDELERSDSGVFPYWNHESRNPLNKTK